MEKTVIKATRRSVTGKKVGALRRAGQLPGVVYGHHIQPITITMDLKETTKILGGMSSSSIVTISVEGEEHSVLVREKQRDYIRNRLTHVDFQAVSLTEKLRTNVPVELKGVSPAVKDFNGVVVVGVDELEVECLPQDLPERIVVDLTSLKKIGDGVYVRDLKISDKVQLHESPDEMVVVITAAGEEEAEGETLTGTEPEVIEKGKKEEV